MKVILGNAHIIYMNVISGHEKWFSFLSQLQGRRCTF